MKMAVARPSIVGCVAENAGFGRNCAIRSCTIADGGPARVLFLLSEQIGGEINRHELSMAAVGGILWGPAMIKR